MIDTDEYEGHTKGRWYFDGDMWSESPNGTTSTVMCICDDIDTDGLHHFIWVSNVDAQLMAAAPDLLAEVKRLDAIVRDIESLIPENPDYVCEQILGACHRYMYPEEFGEVIE